jgi:hypothetical protein
VQKLVDSSLLVTTMLEVTNLLVYYALPLTVASKMFIIHPIYGSMLVVLSLLVTIMFEVTKVTKMFVYFVMTLNVAIKKFYSTSPCLQSS